MRIVIAATAAGLLGCASALSLTTPAAVEIREVASGEPASAHRAPGEGLAAHAGEASSVDRGSALASPFDSISESDLGSPDGREHLGDLYARAGLMVEAIVEYRESVALDPKSAVRHFKLGLAYQSLRQFDDALASYEEAARLEPESAWAHAAVSIVRAKMGNQEGAFAAYETVKDLDADMAEGLLQVILRYGTFHEV